MAFKGSPRVTVFTSTAHGAITFEWEEVEAVRVDLEQYH
jgi:hypothetical protein